MYFTYQAFLDPPIASISRSAW